MDGLRRVDRSHELTTAAGALGIVLLAWLALLLHGDHASASFGITFLLWNVMMVAMMLPSLLPWLFLFDGKRLWLFVGGYLTVWAAYCFAAAAVQGTLQDRILLTDTLALSPRVGGALLIFAGAFQFTPIKNACLTKCRSPIGHLLTRWKSGHLFAFRVGLSHGANCLGCCWALMAVAFALGVMNLWWMGALTLLLVLEKTAPKGALIGKALGGALIAYGTVKLASGA